MGAAAAVAGVTAVVAVVGGATITEVGLAAAVTAVAVGSSAAVIAAAAASAAIPCRCPWGAPGWGRGPVRLVTPAPAGAPAEPLPLLLPP